MKTALLNFKTVSEAEIHIPVSNRAFQYNDGAFETMLFTNGETRFLARHLDRLKRAAEVLHLEMQPELAAPEKLADSLKNLVAENKLSGNCRLKLKVWRGGNGLYTPEQNRTESLITINPQPHGSAVIASAGFAQTVQTRHSAYSFFKGPYSLQYVLAGIEKKQRHLEEIILLSADGFVSECLAANIFWLKNNSAFTPALETGCIAGIMREHLLKAFPQKGISVQEGNFPPEALLAADAVFTSSSTGLKKILQIGQTEFRTALPDWLAPLLTA